MFRQNALRDDRMLSRFKIWIPCKNWVTSIFLIITFLIFLLLIIIGLKYLSFLRFLLIKCWFLLLWLLLEVEEGHIRIISWWGGMLNRWLSELICDKLAKLSNRPLAIAGAAWTQLLLNLGPRWLFALGVYILVVLLWI